MDASATRPIRKRLVSRGKTKPVSPAWNIAKVQLASSLKAFAGGHLDRLREMEVFVAIVDRGSFTGASEWSFYENGLRLSVRLQPRMIVNLAPAAVMAAIDRVGITQLFSYQAAPAVLNGSLQPVLTAFEPESTPVNLLHVERRGASGKVRAFVEFVTETLRKNVHLQYADSAMTMNGADGILDSVK